MVYVAWPLAVRQILLYNVLAMALSNIKINKIKLNLMREECRIQVPMHIVKIKLIVVDRIK